MTNQLLFFLTFFAAACNSQNSEGISKVVKQSDSSSINWLINIKSTGRISSNHFSDFVVDKNGSSYITSFIKGADSHDYIYIAKVNSSGEVLWELGNEFLGRSTAISIDTNQNIWAVGWFYEKLQFGNKKIKSNSSNSFLAQLDKDGNCLQLLKLPENATLFNCHINRFNEILINGVFSGNLEIEDQTLNGSKTQQSFFAKFNAQGKCLWLESINTLGEVRRIRSDAEGNFYLPGSFNTFLAFQGDTLFTSERYDQDGFLIKIDRDGKQLWLKQFGNKGVSKKGHRTKEGAVDITFDSKGNVILAATFEHFDNSSESLLNNGQIISTIQFLKFDKNGSLLQTKIIAKCKPESQAFAMVNSENGHLWLAGSLSGSVEVLDSIMNFSEPQSFALKLDDDLNFTELVLPKHGNTMSFRVAYPMENDVFFSGHYRSNLSIDEDQISNDGNHGIFLFKRSN